MYKRQVYSKASTDKATNNYSANSGKYGDAVYETSENGNTKYGSWYGDYADFPSTSGPFFSRGGGQNIGTYAGVFLFYGDSGKGDSGAVSFRPVLVTL